MECITCINPICQDCKLCSWSKDFVKIDSLEEIVTNLEKNISELELEIRERLDILEANMEKILK